MGRLHVTPSTVASSTSAKTPTPLRIRRPRRSRLLSGTASALDFPRLADELFPDVAVELVEIIIAAPDLGGPERVDGHVVLARDVAEVLHRALVRAGKTLLALRDRLGRLDQMAVEREAVVEVERRRGIARARVGLPVPLQQDVARVLDLGRLVHESSPLVAAPADELLIDVDVRLHVGEQLRLLLENSIEDPIDP